MSGRRRPVPPPPPADAQALTFEMAAGLLGIRRRALDELRRTRPDMPQPILVGQGRPRFVRSELWAWFLAQPRGFSTMGGARVRTDADSKEA